jgi:glycosyltransferase involved in cell wall biosynthesis
MERPRLLIAVTSPLSGVFFHGQLAWLRDQGFEVHFLCSPGAPAEDIVRQQGAEFHAVEMHRGISPWRDLRSLWRLVGVLRRVRPAIVNAGTPKAGMLVILAACLCRVPVRIYTIHGLRFETVRGPLRSVLVLIERAVCALATRVLCVGPGLRGLVLRHRLCAAAKATVPGAGSANGIDLEAFAAGPWVEAGGTLRLAHGIPADAPVIGFVGRLVRDKGIAELVQAWRGLRQRHPSAHLLVVGEVEAGDPVAAADRAALLADGRVHITGFVAEVRPAYAAMQVLVLPTYREGLPTVLLEAGSMGLPVVASSIPGCRDVVADGETGILVPVADAPALEAGLERYLADAALRHRHGHAARARMERDFSRLVVWRSLGEVYRTAAGELASRTAR